MTVRAAELREQGADVITLGQLDSDLENSFLARDAGICAIRDGPTKCTAGSSQLRWGATGSQARFQYRSDQRLLRRQVVFNANFASLDTKATAIRRLTQ
ncbi:hypothetical protein [Bradyrhizobium sp. BR 1432]|uniref:hypothetical protein n=1 Tax=Bradyrhizobium sp. BR 1432 TaxID=3447966 RepID=UPI003EE6541C